MSIVLVYIPSPYKVFIHFLEGQVHKDSKLEIMSNMATSRLAKVIFTNIKTLTLKPIYPRTSQHYNNYSAPTLLILFKKLLAPPPFKREGRNCILYERLQRTDNKVITILHDRFFIYRTVKS